MEVVVVSCDPDGNVDVLDLKQKIAEYKDTLSALMITYPSTQTHLDIPADIRQSYGLTDDLLRISIGIEDAEDLIADLKEALEA